MAHPEAVLFVDDQQPQIFPLHVALQQLVSADQNINFAFTGLFQDLRLLFGAAKTRQHLYAYRPVGEAVAEVVEVLLGEEGSRHQHRHLLVVFHRQESGAHRHFGFAKAHVTADQAVHGQRLAHVAQHGVDGLGLIRRSFKREAVAEQLVLLFIMLKRIALFGRTLGVNIQQLGGHVAYFFCRLLARARPGIAAQLVQRRILFRASGVAADQMQGRHRHIQFGVVGVGQHQVFTFDAACFEGGHPLIATHTVFQVNDRLTGVQFGQVADQGVRVDGAAAVLTTARDALAQQVAFTNQRQVVERINESVLGGADHQVTAISGRFAQTKNALRRDFDPSQQFTQCFTATFTFNGEDHRPGEGLKKLTQIIKRGFLLRLDGQVRQCPEREIGVRCFLGKRVGFELHARPALQFGVELVGT